MYKLLVLMLSLVLLPLSVAAQSSYRVQPGDTLEITVIEDPTLNRTVLVLPDGRISLPLAGTLRAGGLTVEQIQNSVATGLADNFAARPNVFVTVSALAEEEEPRTISVFVTGEVAEPGLVEVPPGTSLLQLIAVVGGPSRFAATKRIQWRRTDPKTGAESLAVFNYQDVLRGVTGRGLGKLRDGDVIVVPERRLFE